MVQVKYLKEILNVYVLNILEDIQLNLLLKHNKNNKKL